ncbi:glycosyltransferase [Spirulina sp. CS-785/01]|uniref:glycosyltransferase n=1 Tax=Spirulina sp. CS-785/01 TaxID=3021716 RepID=UPI0023305BDC|nr:glycosyltransferase [Spirulina sp. CS-785/01]MDB9315601.1 glycosyltransferase [Spirulina sp. CS-785/01]
MNPDTNHHTPPQPTFKLHPQFQATLDPATSKVAVLVTNEFTGFSQNGGIGTYYTTLSQKLRQEHWTIILLLCQTQQTFQGEATFENVHHTFSTQDIPQILTLQPHHQQILIQTQPTSHPHNFDYDSYCSFFFLEALSQHLADAVIYAEFPEIWGFGYRSIQAQQSGLLPNSCLLGVTAHGSFEWLREGNSQYQVHSPQWSWQVYHYEQFSLENATLAYTPSHFLASKYKEYGYKTDHLQHLPYFIPLLTPTGENTQEKREEDNNLTPSPTGENTQDKEDNNLTPSPPSSEKIPLVFFARLEERKGLLTFVEALRSLPAHITAQLHIIFLGKVVQLQSPQLSHLNSQQYIEQALEPLDFRIESHYSSLEALHLIQQLDHPLVCLTSSQENFPNTALEMGQLPISLIVADAEGWREALALVQRQAGVYWFPPSHPQALAQTLCQALANRQTPPTVADTATLTQTNQSLLNQRLEFMSEAFLANAPKTPQTPNVALVWFYGQTTQPLLDILQHFAEQTYQPLQRVVLYADSKEIMAQVTEAQTQWPDTKFIRVKDHLSVGQAYNQGISQLEADYILPLTCDSRSETLRDRTLDPQALATLVTAITHAEASIAVCPYTQLTPTGEPENITFIDGNLLNLLEFPFSHDLTALFKAEFLQQFPYSTEPHIHALNWQLFAAALATDTPIAYYPYPLYCIHANTPCITPDLQPQERYYLRQYLTQIEPQHWHKRQIHLLLTGFEQLRQTPSNPEPTNLNNLDFSTPQNRAWQLTAQQLYQELTQTKTQLTDLKTWTKELQKGKDWLDSQWQSWLLRYQKAEWEWQRQETVLAEIQRSKFWRLRNKWFQFQQKLGRISSDPLQPLPQSHQTPGVQDSICRIAGQKLRFFQPQPTKTPLVSIISTCFDEYYSLETTYRTVVNQTLPQFEWLIVDDGSVREEMKELLTILSQRTEKIRIISQPLHQGKAASYNRAVAQAKGKYLCFLGIGSILDPTYLEKGVLFLESHPEYSLVNSYSIVFQGEEHWWTASLRDPQRILSQEGMWSHPLYRLREFTKVGGFDESLQWFTDWERCLKALSQQQKGETIPEFLDGYRSTEQTTPTIVPQQFEAAKAEMQAIQSRYSETIAHSLSETPPLCETGNDRPISPPEQLPFYFNLPLSPDNPVEAEKRLLLFCPNLDNNDLTHWNCELVQQLARQGYEIVIATTSSGDHSLAEFFYSATPEIFHFPHLFSPVDWLALTRYLIASRQVKSLLISGGEIVYYFLPILRSQFPQLAILDYQSSSNNSLSPQLLQKFSQFLDYQLAASRHQAGEYWDKMRKDIEKGENIPKFQICASQAEVIAAIENTIHSHQISDSLKITEENKQEALSLLAEYLQQQKPEQVSVVSQPKIPSPDDLSIKALLKLLLKKAIKRS